MNQVRTIHETDRFVPEIGGVVRGGLVVVVRTATEIDELIDVCMDKGSMSDVYSQLSNPSMYVPARLSWADSKEAFIRSGLDSEVDAAIEKSLNGRLSLLPGLFAAQELWLSQGEEAESLYLVLMLSKSGDPENTMSIESTKTAFVIRPGSLVGDILHGPFTVTTWALGFVLGQGTTPSARRDQMVDRLRTKALKDSAELEDLRTLNVLSSRPLVVLIHGLFSTDVGTFGQFQSLLEAHFQVVGFPHDTLTQSIEANGRELASLLGTLPCDTIHLVSHSRGGLVARHAVVQLRTQGLNSRIRKCVTFGTPHHGSELAENPGNLLLLAALFNVKSEDWSPVSVLDVLCCATVERDLPGIRDLCPASTEGTSLARLQQKEGLYPDAAVDLFAVGGAREPGRSWERFVSGALRRVIGEGPNDFVVKQHSSLPLMQRPASQRHSVNCDHYSYFGDDQQGILELAVKFLLRP